MTFVKGKSPWNKGMKMSKEFREKCRLRQLGITNWRKGTATKEGHYKQPYRRINGKFIPVAHLEFLKNNINGLWFIPKNWVIHHIDCDPYNNQIDNLSCIPKGVHTKLHNQLSKIQLGDING